MHFNKIATVGDRKLHYWTNEKHIFPNENINNLARLLYVSSNIVMITGGEKTQAYKTYEFNTLELSLKELPPLNYPRFSHGMAWIQGYPAVISGGCDNLNVEIFRRKKWQKHSELKISRRSFACCNVKDRVFLFGGTNKDNKIVKSAEMWDSNCWITLWLILPYYTKWSGINSVGSRILLLGGNINDLNVSSVFSIDYNLKNVQYEHNMDDKYWFDGALWWRINDQIISLSANVHKVEYSIIISF